METNSLQYTVNMTYRGWKTTTAGNVGATERAQITFGCQLLTFGSVLVQCA